MVRIMATKKVERRKERELAFWGIFNTDFGDDGVSATKVLKEFIDEDALKELKTISGDYAESVVNSYLKNAEKVDQLIRDYLKEGWTIEKIAKTDKAILRTAITEMLMTEDPVPKEIAINEAIELSKRYSDEKSSSYINGVLNEVAKMQDPNVY